MYPSCSSHCTSSAETLNGLWSKCKNHIRFLRGDNLVPFIFARALYINVKSMARKELDVSDLEDVNLLQLVNNKIPCFCDLCKESKSIWV